MKKKNLIKCLISMLIFFFTAKVISIILKYVIKINISSFSAKQITLLEFLVELVISILLIFVYFKFIKKESKKKLNISLVIKDVIMVFIIKFILAYIMVLVATLFGISIESSDNQKLVEEYTMASPFLMIVSSVILAPFNEELVFRGGIGNVIKNKKVFVLVSGLIFGLMHVTDNLVLLFEILLIGLIIENVKNKKLSVAIISLSIIIFGTLFILSGGLVSIDMTELINGISYVGLGAYLAYIYTEKNSLKHNIVVHGMNNLISTILFFLI